MSDDEDILKALEDQFKGLPIVGEENISNKIYSATNRSNRLYNFARKTTDFSDMRPEPHGEMCKFIQDALGNCQFKGDEQTLVMVGVPRNSFKTSVIGEAAPLYILDKNPNARGLITSFRHDVAKARLYAVKWHIEKNEKFRAECGDDWMPEFRDDIWNDDAIVITRRNKALREPSLSCAGVGRSMTGAHYDFIIADDLVTDTNVMTKEMRDKVYDYIQNLLPILEPGGVLILVFTRWHPDDAYGRIIKIDEELERQGKQPEWRKLIRSAYNPDGSLYFPTRLTHDFLDRTKRRIGSRRFAAQYLNQPISEEDKTFDMSRARMTDFTYFTDSLASSGGVVTTPDGGQFPVDVSMTWDPAGRKYNRHSDFHGLTLAGCDPTDRWWTLEAEGIKGPPTLIIDRVCSLIAHYRPRVISIEGVGGYGMWIDLLQIEIDKRGLRVAIHEYTTGGVAKGARIEMLQPRWEAGKIIMKPTQHDLYNQFDQFSPGATMDHEDILDSYTQHLAVARPAPSDTAVKENPMDPEWERRKKRMGMDGNPDKSKAGRSGSRWVT